MNQTACATCPWLTANHGKRHPGGWYLVSNLRRLWNGMRTGRAPGMTCHSSDPRPWEPGTGPKDGTVLRECLGSTVLVQRELDALGAAANLKAYRAERPWGLTRTGALCWVNRVLGGGVLTAPRDTAVSLPDAITRQRRSGATPS